MSGDGGHSDVGGGRVAKLEGLRRVRDWILADVVGDLRCQLAGGVLGQERERRSRVDDNVPPGGRRKLRAGDGDPGLPDTDRLKSQVVECTAFILFEGGRDCPRAAHVSSRAEVQLARLVSLSGERDEAVRELTPSGPAHLGDEGDRAASKPDDPRCLAVERPSVVVAAPDQGLGEGNWPARGRGQGDGVHSDVAVSVGLIPIRVGVVAGLP